VNPSTDQAFLGAIGDPTFGGVLVTVAYFVAGWFALAVARCVPTLLDESRRERWVWVAIAAFCLLMGINKQADLQTLLSAMGRQLVASGGWYERRRVVQVAFVLAFAVAGLVVAVAAIIMAIRTSRAALGAVVGAGLLLGFATLRAAEIHHLSETIGEPPWLVRFGFVLEVAGVGVILAAALSRRRVLLALRR
jgi:hypothetical protein